MWVALKAGVTDAAVEGAGGRMDVMYGGCYEAAECRASSGFSALHACVPLR